MYGTDLLTDGCMDGASLDHDHQLLLHLLRAAQSHPGGQVPQGQRDEGPGQSPDVGSCLGGEHLLHQAQVVVSSEEVLVLGDGGPQLRHVAAVVRCHHIIVRDTQRLQQLIH